MRKNNKRALIVSALSLLLCVSMLVGSTMAWFTDNATTGVNKIESGTLDIDLVDEEGKSLEGEALSFENVNGSTEILWEPNATFRTNGFKIQNNGNLAAKYQITINTEGINSKLLEVISFKLVHVDSNNASSDADMNGQTKDFVTKTEVTFGPDGLPVYTTAPFASEELMYIEAHMDQNAGNEYQGLTMEGISIIVQATQDTVEEDSFDDQYDKDATYALFDAAAVKDALAAGKDVTIDGGVYNETISVSAGQTVNVDNAVITDWVEIRGDSKVVINNADVETSWSSRVNVSDGELVINDGDFNGVHLFDAYSSDAVITINGGTFDLQYLTMNNNQGSKITITGGTFNIQKIIAYNFASNCTISGGTFSVDPATIANIADGCTVTNNGDGTWTVA